MDKEDEGIVYENTNIRQKNTMDVEDLGEQIFVQQIQKNDGQEDHGNDLNGVDNYNNSPYDAFDM